ncbi:hypothetical protein OROGR_002554 [Orobanche gracilis]
MVRYAIDGLRETAANRTNKLQQEMSIMQENTSSVKSEWISYTRCAESHYLEDIQWKEGKKIWKSSYINVRGMGTIEALHGRFSLAVSSALVDTETGSQNLLASIDQITEGAGKCLLEELINHHAQHREKGQLILQTIASIEELRTPSFEELLKLFWNANSSKQANGDVKNILEAAMSLRDSRVPLTALN